uniref:Uncharacterized protein n=1 Tax=Meloidogyne enterolobii TaxID=390850 RepID=A0A6V7Y2F0_MELEN|nr:unnamed protein product [Meloidogyne enterolobii]
MSKYSEAANLLNNSITSSFLEENSQEMLNNNCFQNENLEDQQVGNEEQIQSLIEDQTLHFSKTYKDVIDEAKMKSLQEIKENEIEINNFDENLKEELENLKIENENLKKSKEESDQKLIEKLEENKEYFERLMENTEKLTISFEENIKLKKEKDKVLEELKKNNFIIKQLENEKLKNLNEYEGEIEKFQSKVEVLEKEKKCALDLYTNLEIKFEEDKNELISENFNLKADNDRLKIQVMEQSREEGLTSLKLSTENKKVQSENEQLKEKLKNYEFELTEYSVKHEDLKKSIDELNRQITLAKMVKLGEENAKLQADKDILIKRAEEAEFLMDEYSIEHGQLIETIATMDELIKNKEKELDEEKEKVEELNILNKSLDKEFNKIKTEHINLTAKNVKLTAKLENQSKGLHRFRLLEEQNITLTKTNSSLKEMNTEIKNELEKLNEELKKAKESYFKLIMDFFYRIFSGLMN